LVSGHQLLLVNINIPRISKKYYLALLPHRVNPGFCNNRRITHSARPYVVDKWPLAAPSARQKATRLRSEIGKYFLRKMAEIVKQAPRPSWQAMLELRT
ncbi:MAG TPA: hypothetical protein VJN01_10405, partial [Xanthomonadales bacterium]|nr:hypothetical protein [Xanthomonadales bacterium]